VRIATYTRISTDEAHQPYSLEAQAERLSAYTASQEGWQITRRFSDQTSGATLERPGLERALAEAAARRLDLLLVYRVDRLSRSVRGLAQILETLDEARVLFRSATEPFDTSSSAGRMMAQMLGVFAEFERATIVERVIAGMERKAARGEWVGQLPFGYQKAPDGRHLAPHPTQAPVVREIFARYAERLQGTQTLARWLSQRGYETKHGRPFHQHAVLTILRNRSYLGETAFRGIRYPAPHEPLVDKALFDRAQQILQQRGEDPALRRSNQSDYLLTGVIVCDRCAKHYIGAAAHGNGGRYPYYVCFTRQRYGKQNCDNDRLPADQLDHAILDQLAKTLDQESIVRDAIQQAFAELDQERPRREAEIQRIEAELQKTNAALERYFRAFESGTMPERACGERVKQLTQRLTGLTARREDSPATMTRRPSRSATRTSASSKATSAG
jgi:site-specific DNA recombinase